MLFWSEAKRLLVRLQVYGRVKDLADDKVRHDSVFRYSPRTGKFNYGCSIKQTLGPSMTKRDRCQNRAGNGHYSMYIFPKSTH